MLTGDEIRRCDGISHADRTIATVHMSETGLFRINGPPLQQLFGGETRA
jgi:hypothetical protein